MNPTIRELAKLIVVLVFAVLVIMMVTGCAMAVPYAQCSTEYHTAEEVTLCENKGIKREAMRFRRDQQELKRRSCTVPYMWDGRSRQCKSPSMIL